MFLAQNRYKVCSGYEAVSFINDCLKKDNVKLTDAQYRCLLKQFGNSGMLGNLDMDVQFYVWKDVEDGYSWLWRLTLPFHLLYAALVNFIICPIHWIFTGKFTLGNKSKLLAFGYAWYDRIFKNRNTKV